MTKVNSINGSQLKAMLIAGSHWLKAHIAHINALNVYPVPDGDTGTNMFLTLEAALKNIRSYNGSNAGDIVGLVSEGAMMGARGNSGVILSQILNGLSEGLAGKETFSTFEFAQALQIASNYAYKTVLTPVEGTILTVIKEVARVAQQIAPKKAKIGDFLAEVLEVANTTLSLTPELLPLLKEAGVVDSGAQGLVYFLEGMFRYTKGLPVEIDSGNLTGVVEQPDNRSVVPPDPAYGYDVQFLIKGSGLSVENIRHTINEMGDCPLVVGDETIVKVHVHVADPGKPLSYGITQGNLDDIVVENMVLQYQTYVQPQTVTSTQPVVDLAIIAVVPGTGLARVFKSLGAVTIEGGPTMNPSTHAFLDIIQQNQASQVLILPNNPNIILTAEQVKTLNTKTIEVIPTKTIPQGISALLSCNPENNFEANVQHMLEAMGHVQTIEVTQAVKNTTLDKIKIKQGDIIALLNGVLVTTGLTDNQTVLEVLKRMVLDDLEIVTIYYGYNLALEKVTRLANKIMEIYPHLDVEIINGGQPHYQYIISLE